MRRSFYAARSRPCLQYQLKRCSAPCVAKVTDDDYQHQVQYVRMFLQGKSQDVLTQLVDKMEQASASLAFERAAQLRDQIAAFAQSAEQQFVSGAVEELDIIGFDMRNGVAAVHVLFVREHKVLGTKNYFPKIPEMPSQMRLLAHLSLSFILIKVTVIESLNKFCVR